MKLIKLKIKREQTAGRTHYTYPKGYEASKVRFGPFYESSLEKNLRKVRDRGNKDEFIIVGMNDRDATSFLACAEATELSYDEALAIGSSWTEQVEITANPLLVLSIVAKATRGEPLSSEERDALDPNSSTPGINKTKSFKEQLDEFLASEE